MDSSARLDYALFQLTPTRTRCDLVIFSGSRNEKLASGLLDPFISHLRCAKEQIPKGGYSITLRPPTSNASWFTKSTLERFVRFVSTPEVLERFVKIEREISQIEISVQSNEAAQIEEAAADINACKSIVLHKPKVESNETNEAPKEENSKVRLQRVLETRKVVLRKEQAMAYARAYVAGFEMDHLDDLISFSDAFGASRLREACINFKELCHKKHNDGLWMDELAAMQAFPQPELPYLGTSGIILTSESFPNAQLDPNGSLDASLSEATASHASSDINQGQTPTNANANAQIPMQWSNHFPQFMYNFQRPGQQMPPYQGYPYPGMQVPPPYYPANMQWPPNTEESGHGQRESDHRRNRKSSSRKKEKSPNGRRSDPSEQDGHTEPSDSSSESDVDASSQHDRKHSSTDQHRKRRSGKKSSRTVVIRNINYITSKRKNDEDDGVSDESSTGEDELIDGASLKQKVEDAVGSLERHHKSTPHHSKKRGGKKNLSIHNESNGTANEELEDEQGTEKTGGNWDSFQNLLMRDDKSGPNEVEKQHGLDVRDEYFAMKSSESGASFVNSHAIDPESEKGTRQRRMMATDSFIVSNRETANGSSTHLEKFESNGISRPSMGRRDVADEELLFSQRMEDSGRNGHDTLADLNSESSVLKTQKGEDWYIVNQPEKSLGTGATKVSSLYDGDHALKLEGGGYFHEKPIKKDVFGDDSFMVQTRPVEDQPDSHWRTDISMITDAPSQEESKTTDVSGDKVGVSGNYEPDDLCMVLERDLGVEPEGASWTPQMDYEVDSSFTATDKRHSGVQPDDVIEEDKLPTNGKTANGKSPAKKLSGKETKSKPREPLWKSKHEIISRPKKPSSVSRPAIQRSKSEMEEESRRRMEELVIQRQKRIAERSAAKGPTPAAPKTSPVESKTAITKPTSRSTSQETKRLSLPKPSISSSTIDRLASVPAKQKGSSPPSSKSTPPKKTSSKVNGVAATSLSPKISKDDSKKQQSNLDQAKPSKSVNDLDHQEVTCSDVKDQQTAHATNDLATSETLKEPCDPSSAIIRDEPEKMSDVISGVKECDQVPVNRSPIEDNDRGTSNVTPVLYEEKTIDHSSQTNGFNTERVEDHLPTTPEKDLSSTAVNLEEDIDTTNQKLLVSSEITETEIMPGQVESIPPPTSGMSPDPIHTRKKWTSNEIPPPAAKGLKKLLMFGRKSSSPVPT